MLDSFFLTFVSLGELQHTNKTEKKTFWFHVHNGWDVEWNWRISSHGENVFSPLKMWGEQEIQPIQLTASAPHHADVARYI